MIKNCRTCKIYIPQQKTCQLMPNLAGQIEEDDYCSQHKDSIYQCEICGVGLLVPIITYENDVVHIYCGNCIQRI